MILKMHTLLLLVAVISASEIPSDPMSDGVLPTESKNPVSPSPKVPDDAVKKDQDQDNMRTEVKFFELDCEDGTCQEKTTLEFTTESSDPVAAGKFSQDKKIDDHATTDELKESVDKNGGKWKQQFKVFDLDCGEGNCQEAPVFEWSVDHPKHADDEPAFSMEIETSYGKGFFARVAKLLSFDFGKLFMKKRTEEVVTSWDMPHDKKTKN